MVRRILNNKDIPQVSVSTYQFFFKIGREDPKNLGYSTSLTGNLPKSAILAQPFPNTQEIPQILQHILGKCSKFIKANPKYLGLAISHGIYSITFCSYKWSYNIKYIKWATTQFFVVALFYKLNPTQNTTNITKITENLLNSVPHAINNKNSKIFSLIVCSRNLTLIMLSHYCLALNVFLTCTSLQC